MKEIINKFEDGSTLKEIEMEEQLILIGLHEKGADSETIADIKSIYSQMKEIARRNMLDENISTQII